MMSVELQEIDRVPGPDASPERGIKARVLDETKKFLGIFLYLAVVFGLFVLHEWVILAANIFPIDSMGLRSSTR
jgi:hypothetical protein